MCRGCTGGSRDHDGGLHGVHGSGQRYVHARLHSEEPVGHGSQRCAWRISNLTRHPAPWPGCLHCPVARRTARTGDRLCSSAAACDANLLVRSRNRPCLAQQVTVQCSIHVGLMLDGRWLRMPLARHNDQACWTLTQRSLSITLTCVCERRSHWGRASCRMGQVHRSIEPEPRLQRLRADSAGRDPGVRLLRHRQRRRIHLSVTSAPSASDALVQDIPPCNARSTARHS